MLSQQEIHKFWSRVDVRGPDECWPWLAGKNGCGYGVFSVTEAGARKQRMATHIAIFLDRGAVCPGRKMYALHSCDNPSCVNPRHLRFGTPKQNSEDAKARGRASAPPNVRGNQAWEAKRLAAMPRGEDNKASVYKEPLIRDICQRRRLGQTPTRICKETGAPWTLVNDVTYGRAWQHIAREYMPFPRLPSHTRGSAISGETISRMRDAQAAGLGSSAIGRIFGLSRSTVWRLLR
jgi:hypothetical protein